MTISKLPSGRYRVRVWQAGKDVPAAPILGLPDGYTWASKREAKAAEAKAREILRGNAAEAVTVADFHRRWTTDLLFARPKESTNLHNAERTRAFAHRYGSLLMSQVTDAIVAEWLAGGTRNRTVPALRAMFNDAASGKGGRLVQTNPFANLGLRGEKGNKHKQPPTPEQMEAMIFEARRITPPSFAAYLEFACTTAARPGELDALRWDCINFEQGEVYVREQWNVKVRKFTPPKYGAYTLALVDRARSVLMSMRRQEDQSPFVFTTVSGYHYTPSTRYHHWNRTRCASGLADMTLYLATRHYFAWYSLNVLELEPHIVAEQLGHRDGGRLIIQLYGHPEQKRALRRIREAWNSGPQARRLRAVGDGD